ncbi:MAG: protein kinase [Myxococcota bacterium]|nr:protein kinase [Myxococcota bacterium]
MSEKAYPCLRCKAPIPTSRLQCPHCHFELGSGESAEGWLGETLNEMYEIQEILGVGGMGMVFRANRLLFGVAQDEVALKLLFPRFLQDPLQRRLFEDEATLLARLDHPNIVKVFDAGLEQKLGVAFIAMELLEGETFKELMRSEAPMQPERLYPIFTQVCDGLAAAHQAGLIHRDLKPDNIFLSAEKMSHMVQILDFGIAALQGHSAADEENKLLGTLRYMAPEQCQGFPCTPMTDLYAIGIILYESLTRHRASGRTVDAVINDEIIPLNERLPEEQRVSDELEALVMSLVDKDPKKRPQSALELKVMLQQISGGGGIDQSLPKNASLLLARSQIDDTQELQRQQGTLKEADHHQRRVIPLWLSFLLICLLGLLIGRWL